MNNPKISVIVPVYNVEQYLRHCIDSILAQTFTDFELLLIDDGSTDKSRKICDEFVVKDTRVHVLHKENGGVSSARNMGLDNAKGDWISFVDADDWIYPNNLYVLYEACKNNNIGFVIGNFFQKRGNVMEAGSKIDTQFLLDPFKLLYKNQLAIRAGVILVKKTIISPFRFDEELTVNEDTKMWVNILLTTNSLFINTFIHEYLMDNSSLSNCKCSVKKEFGFNALLSPLKGYAKKFIEDIILRTIIRRVFIKDYVGAIYIALKYMKYWPSFIYIYLQKIFVMKFILGYCFVFFILLTNSALLVSSSLTWLICYVVIFLFIRHSDPLSPEPWLFFSWNILFINLFSGIRYIPLNINYYPPIIYALLFLCCFHLGYKFNKRKVYICNLKKMSTILSTKSDKYMQRVYAIAGICSIIGVILVLIDIFFMLGLSMDGGERRAGFIENFSNLSWRTNIGMVLSGGIYISMFSIFFGANKKNSIIGVFSFLASVLYSFAIGGKQGVLLSLLVVAFALLVRKKYNVQFKISNYAKFGSIAVLFFMVSYITLLSSERHENADTGDLLNDTEHFTKEFIIESNKYLPNYVKNTFAEFFGYYCDQLGTFSEQWNLEKYPEKYGYINISSDPLSPFVFIDRQVKKIIPFYDKIFSEEDNLAKRIANQNKGYYGLANWQTILQQGLQLYGLLGLLIVFFMHGYFSKSLVVSTKNNYSYSKLGLCFINNSFMVYTIMCNILGETSILMYLVFLLYCLYREMKKKTIFPF